MVRRITAVIITLLIIISFNVVAEIDKKLFNQANQLYRNGEVALAIAKYQAMKQKGPGVWFNLGTCYFALQEYEQAYVCWRRAEYNAPTALIGDLYERLELVRNFLHKEDSRSFVMQIMERWAQMMPVLLLQILFLCCWYLFWYLLIRERAMRWLLLITVLGILLTGILMVLHYRMHIHKRGIIRTESLIRTGPHDQFHQLGSVLPLEEVHIKEVRQEWYKIESNDCVGWIPAEHIETI